MAKVRKLWEGNITVWDDGQMFYATNRFKCSVCDGRKREVCRRCVN